MRRVLGEVPTVKYLVDENDVLDECQGLWESMGHITDHKAHYLATRNHDTKQLEFKVSSFEEAEQLLEIIFAPCKMRRLRIEPFGEFPHAHYGVPKEHHALYQLQFPKHFDWKKKFY